MALLWFTGIGWDTGMQEIGWTYVFLFFAVVFLIHSIIKLVKEWRSY